MSTLTISGLGNVAGGGTSGASNASLPEATSLLSAPETSLEQSGDPSAMLAVLTMKTAKAERQAHTAMRRSEEATQDKEEVAQVGALREKASDIRTGAFVSGLCSIASSITKASGGNAASAAFDAADKATTGMYKAEETLDQAQADEHEHLAAHAKRAGEDERDAVKDAKDLMDKAIEFYKEYSSGKNQALAAATHRA